VSQRVTATVKREALRLVRIETEHEGFLTTPEHPFATPDSGWVRAGLLVPDDWVVSAKLGTLRVVSVRSEGPAQPVPVFNLSVDPSHAYFVGTDQVLVHNTKCQPKDSEAPEDAIARKTRERAEINRELESLRQTPPASRNSETKARIAERTAQRNKLTDEIFRLNEKLRKTLGVTRLPRRQQERQRAELAFETVKAEIEGIRRELLDLQHRRVTSQSEGADVAARKAALEKQLGARKRDHDNVSNIVTWERRLAELQERSPRTDAERLAIQQEQRDLTARISKERRRFTDRMSSREVYSTAEGRQRHLDTRRKSHHRRYRTKAYEQDTGRPPDQLDLLRQQLAELRQKPHSESRDEEIEHLRERIETIEQIVELRRQDSRVRDTLRSPYREREKLTESGQDTSEVDQQIKKIQEQLAAIRTERIKLQVKEQLLALLGNMVGPDAPHAIDEARLREFERALAEGTPTEQQLTQIERELGQSEPLDADFFDQIWNEAAADEAARHEAVVHEAQEVDAMLSSIDELLQQIPSPERDAALHSSFQRLQQELREERSTFQAAHFALVNELAHIQTTQASSSSGATWQERLKAIHGEQLDLHRQWREGMQARLDEARRRLDAMHLVEGFRDETAEAQLGHEITLLEQELRIPPF
jgi:hypothetical protein